MAEQIYSYGLKKQESLDLQVQIWVRLVISCSILLVFFIDPVNSNFPVWITYTLLFAYTLYSASIILFYDRQTIQKLVSGRASYWIETIVYLSIIAITGASESYFFFFLFFPIFVASFSWGFSDGIKVTFASVILSTIPGIYFLAPNNEYEIGEVVLRPLYLLIFGYMIAYWGRGSIINKRRLQLLQEISTHWNPRFGVDHAIMTNLGRLVDFFGANRCIAVMNRSELSPKFVMYVADHHPSTNHNEAPKEITETTAHELLALPNSTAVAFNKCIASRIKCFNSHIAYDTKTLEPTEKYLDECVKISSLFDDHSFISVPYRQQGVIGRIFLIANGKAFNLSDVTFTWQVSEAVSYVAENMQTIENLITEAGEHERHKISLDVHDTTIQPYIGLTQALEALSREFKTNEGLTEKINEIVNMANMTIQDLRHYQETLRERSLMRGDLLISAVKKQAGMLLRFYGIHVDVEGNVDSRLPGRIAEAAHQIIKEGLSNILRHTNAKKAFVTFRTSDTHLFLEIGNKRKSNDTIASFRPKSICERATSLQGEVSIENNQNDYTVIRVTIPLIQTHKTLLY